MKRWTLAATLVTVLAVAGCSGVDDGASNETVASLNSQVQATTPPTSSVRAAAVNATDFWDATNAYFKGAIPHARLEYLAQSICGYLDLGYTEEALVQTILSYLREHHASQAPSQIFGWDKFAAGVLVVDSGRYYCPEHAAKVLN